MLTQIQHDALKEFLNISIGQAAHLFSQLVGQPIQLTIPRISLLPCKEKEDTFPMLFSSFTKGQILSSSIQFTKTLQGKAMLLFPMDKTRLLIDLFLGEGREDPSDSIELNEMEYDALKEIGNILLNAIMGGLGELLEIKLFYHPPQIEKMLLSHFWSACFKEKDLYILIVYSSFRLQNHNIEGTIVVQISMESISLFMTKIDAYVSDLYD